MSDPTKPSRVSSAPTSPSIHAEGVAFLGSSVASQVLVALFFVLAARGSGPSDFGEAAAALAAAGWLVSLVDFGNATLSMREIAAGRMGAEVFYARLNGRLLLFSSCIAGAIILSVARGSPIFVLAAVYGALRLTSVTLYAALRGLGLVRVPLALAILEPAIAISALLLSSRFITQFVVAFMVSQVVSVTFTVLVSFFRCSRSLSGYLHSGVRGGWADSRHLGLNSIAIAATDLDVPLASSRVSTVVAGEYAAVNRWTRPVVMVTTAFTVMATPRIARASSGRAAWKAIAPATWMLLVALSGAVAMALLAPLLVPLVLGDAYAGAVPALVVLSITAAVGVPVQFMAMFLIYRRHEVAVARSQIFATALQLALVVPLASRFGSLGMAYAVLVPRILFLLVLGGFFMVLLRRGSGQRAPLPGS